MRRRAETWRRVDTKEKKRPLNPPSKGIDGRPITEILKIINAGDREIPNVVAGQIPQIAEATEAVLSTIRRGGRVFFVGAGTSGRLGVMEAAEMPPTFSVPPESFQALVAGGPEAVFRSVEEAEDDELAGSLSLEELGFGPKDVLIAVSASGRTPYVLGAILKARDAGGRTVGIICEVDTPMEGAVDTAIVLDVGPEVVDGSTRMKAGTAQKMALNMITTSAMVKLGMVYDGYMVGVQPTNRKLRSRAMRIIEAIAGLSDEEAVEALEAAGGDVRVAILSAKTGATPEDSRRMLEEAGGSLRRALEKGGRLR